MTARTVSRRVFLILPIIFALIASLALQPARADEAQTRTITSLPITIVANSKHHRIAEKIEKICREQTPRIARELGLTRLDPIEINVVDDMRPYREAHHGELPEWGVAFALLEENRIVVDVRRATREFNSLDEVVPHELSHILMRQRAPHVRFPLWFAEGLAQWQSREWSLMDQWELMQGVWMRSSPRLADMYTRYPPGESRAQQAYRVAYAGFTDLFEEVGFDQLGPFLAETERMHSFENGFREFFGYTVVEYQAYFQDNFEKKYGSGLMALQSGPLLAFAAVLFLAVIVRYLIRRRRKFARLDD